MSREYIYNGAVSCTIFDTIGIPFDLKKGDTITTNDGNMFKYEKHCFVVEKVKLRSFFQRVYTEEEQNRYNRIYENAMVAAMQSLIANLKDVKISSDMHEIELVPKNAIWYANELVKELKEREF